MQWITSLLLKYKSLISFVFTVSISLWMVSLGTTDKIQTASTLTSTIFLPAQFVVHQLAKVKNIWQENKNLRKEVSELRIKNSMARDMVIENKRLRNLVDFKKTSKFKLIPAEVIGQNPDRLCHSLIINVGKCDSVEKNMPVLSTKGVIGKTIRVSKHISQVQLLSDPNCRISIINQRSRITGIIKPKNISNSISIITTNEYSDAQVGDTIITSGLGGIFPKGLLVGCIEKIEKDNYKTFKDLHVHLYADFNYVEEVFVIKRKAVWQSINTFVSEQNTNTTKR